MAGNIEKSRHGARSAALASQKAMLLALEYPEAKHGGSRKAGSSLDSELGFTKGLLSQARQIIRYAGDRGICIHQPGAGNEVKVVAA
ncbi:hypothetical protein GOA99_20345 [Sinorhizobium meliloti]|nr:hypothetical protein [Sinorhizobium meliloti]